MCPNIRCDVFRVKFWDLNPSLMHHPAAPVPEHHANTDRPGSQIAEIWKQAVD